MKFKTVQDYLSLAIKVILVISIIISIKNELWHIMSTNIFLLILMFVPQTMKKYEVKIPIEFEWLLLIFVIFTLFLNKINGIIAPIFFGIAVGFIGFMILAILYSSNQIKKNYFLIIVFSFNFAVAFGFIIELLKYYLKYALGQELGAGVYNYSMQNMTFVILGAGISAICGFVYMRTHLNFFSIIVQKFVKTNPKIFTKKTKESEEEILNLIKEGENEKTEFKSTLRINLHTKEFDKKIEYSALKTICAFLNSEGGSLLIGVSNNGDVSGIDDDKFENYDKFNLHFTNLIKEKIGKKYLNLINIQQINVQGKLVAKVDCGKSEKPVFLKLPSDEEEFYIRAGPSSPQIKGRELVEYIERKFKE